MQALIIDDDSKNIAVLARMLHTEGLETIQVTDPEKIDAVLEQINDLRVVFLDLEMPGLDGYQVLDHLKSSRQFQSVPIVASTVHVSEINVAHQRGFDGFLGKPFDSDKFPNQLARILAGKPVWENQ